MEYMPWQSEREIRLALVCCSRSPKSIEQLVGLKNMIVDGKQKQASFQDNVEIDLHLKASSTA